MRKWRPINSAYAMPDSAATDDELVVEREAVLEVVGRPAHQQLGRERGGERDRVVEPARHRQRFAAQLRASLA